MISEERINSLVLEFLTKVTTDDPSYRDFQFKENTVLIGTGSVLDSILFTALATELEERIEDETGQEYVLNLEEVFSLNRGKTSLDVQNMARGISELLIRRRSKTTKRK